MHPLAVADRARAERFTAARRRLRTIAVTGTNGKTTTTSMVAAIVAASGEPAARLTTVGAWVDGDKIEAATATDEFLATVETAVARGVRTLALEVTSKALGEGLVRRWPADLAIFTNLTRDHLDLHKTPEAYLAAKAQLFLGLPPGGVAVLNADDPSSDLIAELLPATTRVVRYSLDRADVELAARAVALSADGTALALAPSPLADRLGGTLTTRAIGRVHAANALGAALAADAAGYPADGIRAGLAGFATVAGRFEVVGRAPLVVVDYAHTPDGLDGTLATARALCPAGARLVCVFGCGGNRDRGKRAEMGSIAHRAADRVVLTSDNPRHEAPDAIAADVQAGAVGAGATWQVELDRARAIAGAIAEAAPADVVVIAGKGHETDQEVAGVKRPFSDVAEARAALARRAG